MGLHSRLTVCMHNNGIRRSHLEVLTEDRSNFPASYLRVCTIGKNKWYSGSDGPAWRRINPAARRQQAEAAAEKPSGCLHVSGHKSMMAAIDRSWHLASSVHSEAVFLHISSSFPIGSSSVVCAPFLFLNVDLVARVFSFPVRCLPDASPVHLHTFSVTLSDCWHF